ncbi:MAG: DNRLRE domain-containing protein [Kiritimatiellae bacterium]|nr:DNRLRE domain-containing protein [Kiritimatiellia bacterium]
MEHVARRVPCRDADSRNQRHHGGRLEVPAGSLDTWQTIDVTEAVKAVAPRGRLALHVYTYWDGNSGDGTPFSFASSDRDVVASHPLLEFQGTVDTSASSLTLLPTDDVFIEAGHPNSNYGVSNAGNGGERYFAVLAQRNNREGFLKFDLSGIGAERVDSAVLLMRMSKNQANHTTGNMVQFQLTEKTDWSEAEVTWNNAASQTGMSPASGWPTETPPNAVRVGSANTNVFHTVELAPLVNQILASGKTTLSLHIKMRSDSPTYFIFYSKESSDERTRPRLLVTPKVDVPLTPRKPLQETFVSNYSTANMDMSFYDGQFTNYVQVGYRSDIGTGVAQYGVMLFDPSKLEDAPFVRLRVKGKNTFPAGPGSLRVTAYVTDAWNETNLTWNTATPWFPKPTSVTSAAALDGEVADFYLTQNKAYPYFEADVTEIVRTAAQSGRMVTFGFFSNYNWPEIYKGASAAPAFLIFPDPDATFGNKVTCSLDRSGVIPALRLAWSPSAAEGATYMVERQNGGAWKTVATGLAQATCLDASAEPNVAQTYRITETTSGESVVKSVTLVPTVKVFACADTYVRNGGDANASFGTGATLVHKYSAGNNDGGTREGLYRFDLSEIPADFDTATFKLYTTGVDGGYDSSAHVNLYVYPDFDWTDANAPTWNTVFSNGWPTQKANTDDRTDAKRAGEVSVGQFDVTSSFVGADEVSFDVASAIRAARAAGASHITLHSASYCGSGNWNFGFIPRERSQGISLAPQIEFTLKNWVRKGFIITIR